MTDEQIIKALKCCGKGFGNCEGCPYDGDGSDCVTNDGKTLIMQDCIDLINRQKAEILELQKRIINWRSDMDYRPEQIKSEARKEFAEKAKPIIEEMVDVVFDDNISRCFVNNCRKPTSIPCESKICIEENKAFWTTKIDNLLKEMENGTEKQTKKDQNNNPKIINHVMKSMLKW